MAINYFLRRASSSLIPLSMRSLGYRRLSHGAISVLNAENRFVVGGQFLPVVRFSTVTDNNIASLLESDHDKSDDEIIVADRSQFKVLEHSPHKLSLSSKYQKENISVSLSNPCYYEGQDPVSPMKVFISRGHQNISFDMLAKPDQFKVYEIKMRNDYGEHLENFEGYLSSKGINFDMAKLLFDHLGIKPKNNTPANP